MTPLHLSFVRSQSPSLPPTEPMSPRAPGDLSGEVDLDVIPADDVVVDEEKVDLTEVMDDVIEEFKEEGGGSGGGELTCAEDKKGLMFARNLAREGSCTSAEAALVL